MVAVSGKDTIQITESGIFEFEALTLKFRSKLREIAVELSQQTGHTPLRCLTPEVLRMAMTVTCRGFAAEYATDANQECAHVQSPKVA